MKGQRISEKQLGNAGYTEGADGIWRKAGSLPPNPPSGGNPKPSEKRPLQKDPQVERPPIQRLIALVTVRTVRPRDYDGLGASTKYYFDALQRLGVIEDDSPEHIEIIYNAEKCCKFAEEETVIEIFTAPTIE